MALAKMTWDQLNALVGYKISEPFDLYYVPMEISKKQKERRIELAKRLDDVFIGLLMQYFYADQYDTVVSSEIFERTRDEYLLAITNFILPDEYIEAHAMSVITKTVDVLRKHKDDPYYYSEDRARAISEGDANSVFNYTEYEEAAKHKRFKTWNTIMDGHERDSHAEVNGVTIPIEQPFVLRGGYVQFPRDESMDVSDDEIISCRCSLTFS